MGNAVPVLLCLVDVSLGRVYYVCLNDTSPNLVPENPKYRDQGTVKLYVPAWNVLDQKDPSFGFIKMLARRSKSLLLVLDVRVPVRRDRLRHGAT